VRGEERWDGGLFPIHDPEGVKRVLADALANRFPEYLAVVDGALTRTITARQEMNDLLGALRESGMSRSDIGPGLPGSKEAGLKRAAGEIGISRDEIRRLTHGEKAWVSWRTRLRLERFLTDEEWNELRDRLMSPAVQRAEAEYRTYVNQEQKRFRHDIPRAGRAGEMIDSFAERMRNKGAWASRVEVAVQRSFHPFAGWGRLRDAFDLGEILNHFERRLAEEEKLIRLELRLLYEVFNETPEDRRSREEQAGEARAKLWEKAFEAVGEPSDHAASTAQDEETPEPSGETGGIDMDEERRKYLERQRRKGDRQTPN